MRVSAIIVTRGDHDLTPVLDSLAMFDEIVVWDNSGVGYLLEAAEDPEIRWGRTIQTNFETTDLSVYGRYAAIEYASHDLVFCQDDDVIVSDPQAIVDAWIEATAKKVHISPVISRPSGGAFANVSPRKDHLVANMPQEFRHEGYTDSCLVGFGACFHRDLPARAFDRFMPHLLGYNQGPAELLRALEEKSLGDEAEWFRRTCDVVFTTLTPRVLVDVPKENLDYAYGEDRMWRQPDHVGERARMLELARRVRDGG